MWLGKNLESLKRIDEIVHRRIPFKVLHYHPDNDKSILKVLFKRVRQTGSDLSRSRPYKKNDNAHVEQKGGDRVRNLVGYFRYDTEEEVGLLNEIYEVADSVDNFFIPTVKLKFKITDSRGASNKEGLREGQDSLSKGFRESRCARGSKGEAQGNHGRIEFGRIKETA